VILGVGLAFTFVPLTTVTFATIPREAMGNATGIFNLMRNIGGSAGIAMVTTMLARRSQFHQTVLAAHVTPYDLQVQMALQRSEQLLQASGPPGPVVAPPPPLALLYGEVQRQSAMQAVLDNFWLLGVLMAVLVLGLLLLRKARRAGGAPG
jgi:DHA2 family multidrug resistance protein